MKKRLLCAMLGIGLLISAAGPAGAQEDELVVMEGNDWNDGEELIGDGGPEDILLDDSMTDPEEGGSGAAWEEESLFGEEAFLSGSEEGNTWDEIRKAEEAALQAEAEAEQAGLKTGEIPWLRPASRENLVGTLDVLEAIDSPIGSDGELQAAAWIEQKMTEYGYKVTEQPFHEGFLNENYMDMPGVNIFAERGADSQNRSRKILLITAHYDSRTPLLFAEPESESPDEDGREELTEGNSAGVIQIPGEERIWDPANDKTGAAVMLETAAILSGVQTDVDVCFVFLSGEEDGYYGSLRLIESLSDDLRSRICGVICIGPMGLTDQEGRPLPVYLGTADGLQCTPSLLLRMCAARANARAVVEGVYIVDPSEEEEEIWAVIPEGEMPEEAAMPESNENALIAGANAPAAACSTAERFISAGFETVSAGQYPETNGPDGEEIRLVDADELARTADILADAIVRYMVSAV